MNNKRILITGINGFIGKELSKVYCKKGYEVWGIGRKKTHIKNYLKIDLTDKQALLKAKKFMPKFQTIIHSAAIAHGQRPPEKYNNFTYNVIITKNVIAFSEDIEHLIFISSVSVYGEYNRKGPVNEEHDLRPSSEYGRSKKYSENLVLKSKIKNCTILRLCPVYNESNLDDVRKRVFLANLWFLKIKMFPSPKFSLVHLNTVVNMIFNFTEIPNSGKKIYIISDKEPLCQNKIIKWFSGISIPFPVFITLPFYYFIHLIPGVRGYQLRCLYCKLFRSNIYESKNLSNVFKK